MCQRGFLAGIICVSYIDAKGVLSKYGTGMECECVGSEDTDSNIDCIACAVGCEVLVHKL